MITKLSTKLSEYFTIINEVNFSIPIIKDNFDRQNTDSFIHMTSTIKVQAYSNIGRNVEFQLCFQNNKVTIDDRGNRDIDCALRNKVTNREDYVDSDLDDATEAEHQDQDTMVPQNDFEFGNERSNNDDPQNIQDGNSDISISSESDND